MAINKTGIAITIKAFLPIGKTLDEQLTALTMVKEAHETGDYAAVLKAAIVDEVKSEQKTRRVEEEPEAQPEAVTEPEPIAPDEVDVGTQADPIDDGDDEFGGEPIGNEFGDADVIPDEQF